MVCGICVDDHSVADFTKCHIPINLRGIRITNCLNYGESTCKFVMIPVGKPYDRVIVHVIGKCSSVRKHSI